jgi:hypothetical protein
MSGADEMSLGATNVELDGVGPQPRDDTGSSLWDLVMHGAGFGVPRVVQPQLLSC